MQATGVNLAFFSRQKKSRAQCDIDLHSGKKLTKFDPDQTAPVRFNQGLHYLQTSSTSASFACIIQILGNAMCREGYFLFLKKKVWASKFFYRTSGFLFHLSCGQVEIILICQPLRFKYPRMENSSIQTRTTSLKLFTNLTNQMKYVTIQIEHPDEDKQENNTSGADRTVNDVFKS